MAVQYTTDFDDYAIGTADLAANGWIQDEATARITGVRGHSGTRSMDISVGEFQTGLVQRIFTLDPVMTIFDLWVYLGSTDSIGSLSVSFWGGNPPEDGMYAAISRTGVEAAKIDLGTFDSDSGGIADAWVHFVVEFSLSAGTLSVFTNGTQRLAMTGLTFDISDFDHVSVGGRGLFDDFEIRTGTTPPGGNPPPNSAPCCSDCDCHGGGNPGPTLPPREDQPLPTWQPRCEGGGTVPQADDVVNSEVFA
jgi:hypothetical protein